MMGARKSLALDARGLTTAFLGLGVEPLLEPHVDEGLIREGSPCRLTPEPIDHVDRESEVDRLRAADPRRIDALVRRLSRVPVAAMLVLPPHLLGRRQPNRQSQIRF
jgi:hypothetical protein